ncbi:MAG: hypothetical protein ACO38Q_07680 [Aquiluna sp.]
MSNKTTAPTKTYETDTVIGAELARMMKLKMQIDSLQEQLDTCKAGMLAHAKRHGFKSLTISGFSASVRERQTWTYSNKLQLRINQIKLAQKMEQEGGIAKAQTSEHLVLTFKAKDLASSLP